MSDFIVRSGLGQQVGFMLRQANSSVWADLTAALEPVSLKPQVHAILVIIDTNPGCKQQDVADALGIQRPNLVALIDSLVDRGLVARHINIGDRRSYALELTDAGRALLAQSQQTHRAHERRIAAALGDMEFTPFIAALERLAMLAP